ncbi:Gfo/Idh/MocA family oxidoreductase [candidate division KSB1 bacterium]|nr:Gfo/Idh/MocA family oxidoreductase [candidate division KSB1 bacterium]
MNKQNRRHFLQSSLVLGAGLLATQTLKAQTGIASDRVLEKKLGVALVGLGYYSTDVLAPALQETKNCYLAGIVTGTPSKEKIWMEKYNIPRQNVYNYKNFEQIAENTVIDIVYVVLPNSMHAEYTIRAAKAGKHVICEKPMALSVAECQSMIDACRQNKRKLSIGYRMQFEPHTQEIIRYGREKVFGQVRYVNASAGFNNRSPKTHWKLQKALGGGVVMDMGVYSIQAARYCIGEEPLSVTAQSFNDDPTRFDEVDQEVTMQLEFPGGAMANLMTSFRVSTNMLYVAAEKGWYILNPFSGYRGIKGMNKDRLIEFPSINQQATQMDEVAWCIVHDQVMRVPGEEGLRDMKVVEAIRKALKTGGKIKID